LSDYFSTGDIFSTTWWTEHFVGIQNYQYILLHYSKFHKSFTVSVGFIITTVPIRLAVALFVAHILNFKLRGINFFRTAFYLPTVLGGSIAVSVLWRFVFAQQGLVNGLMSVVGLEPIPWFADENYAIWTIILLNAWQFGSAMVIFLAALQNVPQSLYEAASIDGASKMQMFLKVTIPIITPVIFFNFIMQMVNASQEFNAPYVITEGGPVHSTYLLSLYIYEESFKNMAMGYGASLAWILFVSISLMTAFAFWSQKYWVFYSGDKRK